MPHYKNFAQCVEQLLKEHHLTVSRFGAQIGARSELRRALSNDLSSARRASLCEKLCLNGPFTLEECEELRESLEISRIGLERYAAASPSTGLCPSRRMNRRSRAAYPAAR